MNADWKPTSCLSVKFHYIWKCWVFKCLFWLSVNDKLYKKTFPARGVHSTSGFLVFKATNVKFYGIKFSSLLTFIFGYYREDVDT